MREATESLSNARQWDIAAVIWSQVSTLLDQGWEPFAVVQREPLSRTMKTEATIYLRRPHVPENGQSPSVAE